MNKSLASQVLLFTRKTKIKPGAPCIIVSFPFLFLFFLRITVKESFDTVDKEGNLIKCGWRKEFLAPPFSLLSRAHLFVEIQMGAITFTYLKTGNKTEKN